MNSSERIAILVTGGCGFIASHVVHKLIDTGRYKVVNLDRLDFCASKKNIEYRYDFDEHRVYKTNYSPDVYQLVEGDINNKDLVMHIMRVHNIRYVYHFAAQTHVDHSFGQSMEFIKSNVLGTGNLLECTRAMGDQILKFVHVSTDEVYGEITTDEQHELMLKYALYNPTNPYAATKVGAEVLAKSFYLSYKMPIVITRSNNVYGPHQYKDKVIPKFITKLHNQEKCCVYGNGRALRKYLYVEDAADAYLLILEKGEVGNVYEMDSPVEMNTLVLVHHLVTAMHPNREPTELIDFVQDRNFHDQRYALNPRTLKDLGWEATTSFDKGLARTIEWYTKYAIPSKHWE